MSIFGSDPLEQVAREVFPLLHQGAERLKQAKYLRDNLGEVARNAPWLEEKRLEELADNLVKYATAVISLAAVKLGDIPTIKSCPFLNVALRPNEENAIISILYGNDARKEGAPEIRTV